MLRSVLARRSLPPASSSAGALALHPTSGSRPNQAGRISNIQRAGSGRAASTASFTIHPFAASLSSSSPFTRPCPSHSRFSSFGSSSSGGGGGARRGIVSQSASGDGSSAGDSGSGSGGKRGDELVGVNARDKALETEFLPMGQLPHVPNLLLIPVIRPVMPGLSFDIDLRLYPAATRAALDTAIATGQPYVTLVLLQPTERAAVIAKAEQHLSKKERQLEGFEKREPQERRSNPDVDLLLAKLNILEGNDTKRVPVYPLIRELGQVHAIGVAAEVKITGPRIDAPRLTGMVHRRVMILGPVEESNAAPIVPFVAEIPKAIASDAGSEVADEAAAAAIPVHLPRASAPLAIEIPSPPAEAMRVRVKHLEEMRSSATPAALAAASGDPTAPVDPTLVAEKELEEKAYVKEINQTIMILSSDEPVSQRLKAIATNGRSLTSVAISPGRMADLSAHIANATELELQHILETPDVQKRLRAALWLWKKEMEELRIQKDVHTRIREKYEKQVLKNSLREERRVMEELIQKEQMKKWQREEEEARKDPTRPKPDRPNVLKGNGKDALRMKFTSRINKDSGKVVPDTVQKVIDEELSKLSNLEPEASEYQVTRNYIDWLTSLPWGVYTPEKFDLDLAEEVLNAEHYGMEDVKQRIYEFIASGMLLRQVPPGKILCLVGPPGVGKTSIGKSIATALQRKFYRISVGGMDDVSEIKGHRRTYVGSMPGKLVQSLKRVEASNPVILIDEIDKLGRGGMKGDPASALLEVLDPEQNNTFMDQYLDVPVDLSKVLFICTANDRSQIPGPLADRMDFITLSGYVLQEKMHIARNHLIPQVSVKTGVAASSLTLTDDALLHLIRWYCREAGVRGLQKQLDMIFRKVALKIARANDEAGKDMTAATTTTVTTSAKDIKEAEIDGSAEKSASSTAADATTAAESVTPPMATTSSLQLPIVITSSNLSTYVGKPLHTTDRMYEENPVGVATGLGTNSMGGWLLYTECTLADQNTHIPEHSIIVASDSPADRRKKDRNNQAGLGMGSLFCTGQLGDVIKESSSIAYTVAKRLLAAHTHPASKHRHFFNRHRVHLHLPEGATPKDGPSAGIAMVTGLLSLALNTPPIVGHAMTGELTLTGLVLPIGGVKEKLMAAKHAGITLVLLPAENKKDVLELKPYVIEGLHIQYVTHVDEVFTALFPHFRDSLHVVQLKPTEVPVGTIVPEGTVTTAPVKRKRTTKKSKNQPEVLPTIDPTQQPSQQPASSAD
jgi:Lon-like ATP-dependent protease